MTQVSRIAADRLLGLSGVRPGADPRRLTGLLYSRVNVASYVPLVLECGWPLDEWEGWVFDLGARELIDSRPLNARGRQAAPNHTAGQ